MTDIMIRVEAEDYDAWLKTHYDHVEDRHSYGMTDGPVYRDIDNPNAALFHIHVENLDRAMQWFRTDTFKDATNRIDSGDIGGASVTLERLVRESTGFDRDAILGDQLHAEMQRLFDAAQARAGC